MSKSSGRTDGPCERVIVTLPKPIVSKLQQFAALYRGGNKSGFVADSIQAYIAGLSKIRHTAKLRQAYAAAARQSVRIAREWQPLDDEAWAKVEPMRNAAVRPKKISGK